MEYVTIYDASMSQGKFFFSWAFIAFGVFFSVIWRMKTKSMIDIEARAYKLVLVGVWCFLLCASGIAFFISKEENGAFAFHRQTLSGKIENYNISDRRTTVVTFDVNGSHFGFLFSTPTETATLYNGLEVQIEHVDGTIKKLRVAKQH